MPAAFTVFKSAMSVPASVSSALVPAASVSTALISTAVVSAMTIVTTFGSSVFKPFATKTRTAAVMPTEMFGAISFEEGAVMVEIKSVAEMSIPSRVCGVVIIKFYGRCVAFCFRKRIAIRIDIRVVVFRGLLGYYGCRRDIDTRCGHPEPDAGTEIDLCLTRGGGETSCCDHRGEHKCFHNCRFSC
jgi:hypothetical protein